MTMETPESAARLEDRARRRRSLAADPRRANPRRAALLFSGSAVSLVMAVLASVAWRQSAPTTTAVAPPQLRQESPRPTPVRAPPPTAAPTAVTPAAPAASPGPRGSQPLPPPAKKAPIAPTAQAPPAPAPLPPSPAKVPAGPAPSAAPALPAAGGPTRGRVVQIGAFPSRSEAEAALTKAAGRFGDLRTKSRNVESVSVRGATLYRAQFTGFASKESAQAACAAIQKAGTDCFVK